MSITSLCRQPGLFGVGLLMLEVAVADERFFDDKDDEEKNFHFLVGGACACVDASEERVDEDQRLRSCCSGFGGSGGRELEEGIEGDGVGMEEGKGDPCEYTLGVSTSAFLFVTPATALT